MEEYTIVILGLFTVVLLVIFNKWFNKDFDSQVSDKEYLSDEIRFTWKAKEYKD